MTDNNSNQQQQMLSSDDLKYKDLVNNLSSNIKKKKTKTNGIMNDDNDSSLSSVDDDDYDDDSGDGYHRRRRKTNIIRPNFYEEEDEEENKVKKQQQQYNMSSNEDFLGLRSMNYAKLRTNMMKPVTLKKYFPQYMFLTEEMKVEPFRALVISPSNTGKSTLCKFLMYCTCRHGRNPNGIGTVIVLSGSEQDDPFYTKQVNIKKERVCHGWDPEWLNRQLTKQMKMWRKLSKQQRSKGKYHLLVVFDDLMEDISYINSPILTKLCIKGRHIGISILNIIHEAVGASKRTRNQYDFVLTGRDLNRKSIECLYNNFFAVFDTQMQFKKTMLLYTSNYKFMVYTRRYIKSSNPLDTVLWTKVPKEFAASQKRLKLCLSYDGWDEREEVEDNNGIFQM